MHHVLLNNMSLPVEHEEKDWIFKLFKKGHNRWFGVFKPQYVCSKLLDGNQQSVTDPSYILELFRSYFSDLASSNMHTNSAVSSAANLSAH